jgi:hypothetical protein
MRLKHLLLIHAAVSGASGASAVLAPAAVLSLYGVSGDPAAELMAQYAGLGSIAVALVAWCARNVADRRAQRAITLAFFVTCVIGTVISALGVVSGVMKAGWPVIALYLLLALGYAYFQFMNPDGGEA